MELFVIIVNGWKPLTIITKSSTLDVAAAPDPLLDSISSQKIIFGFLDDPLGHKMLLNHISLIFKNYSHNATESKNLNFNILKKYLTKTGDNDKCSKKWTVITRN